MNVTQIAVVGEWSLEFWKGEAENEWWPVGKSDKEEREEGNFGLNIYDKSEKEKYVAYSQTEVLSKT